MPGKHNPILPPATIGILGGGQLGRMIALEARRLGYGIAVLDPTPDCPASHLADHHIVAPYSDQDAVRKLAELSRVITFEFENVNPDVLQGVFTRPPVEPLYISRNRIREKAMARDLGIPTAPYFAVQSLQDLKQSFQEPSIRNSEGAILKTCEGGYDGKGQWKFKPGESAGQWILEGDPGHSSWILDAGSQNGLSMAETRTAKGKEDSTGGTSQEGPGELASLVSTGTAMVLEGFVQFSAEFSIVATGFPDGSVHCFQPIHNEHKNGILHASRFFQEIPDNARNLAMDYAHRIARHFGYVGTFAVEFFLDGEQPIFNEMAPRPHNSGHLTLDACYSSQFEQHVRAICALPSGNTASHSFATMVNLIGDECKLDGLEKALGVPGLRFHWYGKRESKRGRKMGHITALSIDAHQANERAFQAYDFLGWVRQ